ncbi:Peptidase S8 and S53 subtilisin kexin sedolisin [Frankia canadensis]|uniref:Peptidase S8 and S53 subtilisin kexin sedolisin n=1 Tax=Frankia canadensis TaxID=1836972 RepID=A0A2I2KIW5_9ACTN|nr:S8 family peptidase [Frankia canadensis]SNQ45609.1 Peptidase S8 and S53 subtilisin kexin sedolisin [Frankia canadensis]SOU52899.1 Peptidase S8 and S53 subtilisin kexin sedolisin [Frankia canadensis]
MSRRLSLRTAACGLLAGVALTQLALTGTAHAATPDVTGRYIVVLKSVAPASGSSAAVTRARTRGVQVTREFRRSLNGYAAQLDASQLAATRADPDVDFVEPDAVVHVTDDEVSAERAVTQRPADWGLDRVDQRRRPLNNTYTYASTGNNVTAYVIDTGIRTSHQDFGGRARGGFSVIDDGHGTDDCDGHGTHVAGIVGGSTYGVAKSARLVGVRVLDCDGFGTISGVISGIDWVTADHAGPAVVNMSLGANASRALDQAVRQSINSGLTYSVAAGNSNGNACNESPSRVPGAITVGATTSTDSRDTNYSNFGRCVDLFAPGTDITSDWNSSDSATNTISGTSMATPFVTGVAALYLQRHRNAGPTNVRNAIVDAATPGTLTDIGAGSPNALLYSRAAGF